MCNLVDALMEQQCQDPEYIAWVEQKNQELNDQWNQYKESMEYAYDVICSKMDEEYQMMKEAAETDYEYCM